VFSVTPWLISCAATSSSVSGAALFAPSPYDIWVPSQNAFTIALAKWTRERAPRPSFQMPFRPSWVL
jgi:hypothetical protein